MIGRTRPNVGIYVKNTCELIASEKKLPWWGSNRGPLEQILRSERSTTELAGPGLFCRYYVQIFSRADIFKVMFSLVKAAVKKVLKSKNVKELLEEKSNKVSAQ